MKKLLPILLLALSLLVACTPAPPSDALIQTAIAQTQAAQPVFIPPTETPFPTATSVPSFQKWSNQDVVTAFQDAGLEVESPRLMKPDDYKLAPLVALEGTRFLIPSLCEDCGGRIFSFDTPEDLEAMHRYYIKIAEGSAIFFSWVFTKDNILVQINGDLPEEQAAQYEIALSNLK